MFIIQKLEKIMQRFYLEEAGEVAISYAVIAATMTVAIIVAIFAIGGDVNDMIAAVSFSR